MQYNDVKLVRICKISIYAKCKQLANGNASFLYLLKSHGEKYDEVSLRGTN